MFGGVKIGLAIGIGGCKVNIGLAKMVIGFYEFPTVLVNCIQSFGFQKFTDDKWGKEFPIAHDFIGKFWRYLPNQKRTFQKGFQYVQLAFYLAQRRTLGLDGNQFANGRYVPVLNRLEAIFIVDILLGGRLRGVKKHVGHPSKGGNDYRNLLLFLLGQDRFDLIDVFWIGYGSASKF